MREVPSGGASELLHARVEVDGDAATLALSGELDVGTEAIALRRLEALGPVRRLVLDLRELTFMGSTGLRLVLRLHAEFERDGRELVLVTGPLADRLAVLAGVQDSPPFAAARATAPGG